MKERGSNVKKNFLQNNFFVKNRSGLKSTILFAKNRKGVSPVIATVLLIGIVVVIGLVVFLWFRGLTRETVTKFGEENIELACDDVQFQASYSNGFLSISNLGNVPIYDIRLKQSWPGGHKTEDLSELSNDWPETGLKQGGVFSGKVSLESSTEEIFLIPVLIGRAGRARKTHVCEEGRHGYRIILT